MANQKRLDGVAVQQQQQQHNNNPQRHQNNQQEHNQNASANRNNNNSNTQNINHKQQQQHHQSRDSNNNKNQSVNSNDNKHNQGNNNNNYNRRDNNKSSSNNNMDNSGNQQNQNQSNSQRNERNQRTNNRNNSQNSQSQDRLRSQSNSGPRERAGQAENNNYGNDRYAGPGAGAMKFIPGAPTIELPPIETKVDSSQKKFTGRCRLFVANLPQSITESNLRDLFKPHGEIGEVFLGPKNAFAFIKMDTRQNAENARTALDCKVYEGRTLRVRLAAHAAAVRVKNLSSQVTNELLAYGFRYFGEIERAVIITDDRGRSTGEGIVEYARKTSAMFAIKRCQQESFLLTNNPRPVLVEPMDQRDEDEGFPEKQINKNTQEFRQEREVGPRFAEQGSFEYAFAVRWKDLYEIEKQKRERLEGEIQEARRLLQEQAECSRLEHDTDHLRAQLKHMEDNKQRYTKLKEQHMADEQQREEQRRHEDMLLRQREDEILRRQQMGDNLGIRQQETELRMQATALQDLLDRQERESGMRHIISNEQGQSQPPQTTQQLQSPFDLQTVSNHPTNNPQHSLAQPPGSMPPSMNMMGGMGDNYNTMEAPVHQHQGVISRNYAEATMMGVNQQQGMNQHMHNQANQQQGMNQHMHNQANQQHHGDPFGFAPQQFGAPMAMTVNPNYVAPPPPHVMGVMGPGGPIRPQRYNRPFNGGNNGGGPPKRKRF